MWLSKDKRSGYYRAYWTDQSGKQRSISTKQTLKPEALAWAKANKIEEMEKAAKLGALTPQLVSRFLSPDTLTLQQAIQKWEAWATTISGLSPSTVHQMRIVLGVWSRDIGNPLINSVTTEQIFDYVNRTTLSKTSTIRNALSTFRSFFQYLLNEGVVVGNPANNCSVDVDRFTHAQRESGSRTPFTEEEISTLVENSTGFWRVAIAIASRQAGRIGDLASLEWDNLSEDGVLTYWTDKSDTRVSVRLDERSLRLLREVERKDRRYIFPVERAIALDPSRRAFLSVQFGRLCKKNGISGKSFHCIRHFRISQLAAQGVPITQIAELAGHSGTAVTEGYIHE